MTAAPRPLTAAAFAPLIERFGLFEPRPHLAVAVSGGRDSMALIHLADIWARNCGGSVTALIVDHGLRRTAAQEAATTQTALRDAGIAAVQLRADGRATGNLQAWARHQRYTLMNDWCRRNGVLHLLVAHHANDLAETVLAALTRNTGLAGAAGMAAVRELPDCRLLRPLLDVPRARLEATLAEEGIGWIDDPSNRDRRFRRVRLRERLAGRDESSALARRALQAGQARREHERRAADLLAESLRIESDNISLAHAPLAAAEPETVALFIAALTRWIGGRSKPPRQTRIDGVTDWLFSGKTYGPETTRTETTHAEIGGQRTLGGCRFDLSDGRLWVRRQPDRAGGGRHRQPRDKAIAHLAEPTGAAPKRPTALFPATFGALPLTKPFGDSEVARVG